MSLFLVSRGRLQHPTAELFELAINLYVYDESITDNSCSNQKTEAELEQLAKLAASNGSKSGELLVVSPEWLAQVLPHEKKIHSLNVFLWRCSASFRTNA